MSKPGRALKSIAVFFFLLVTFVAYAETLDEQIYEVDVLREGPETPFDQVESKCRELLDKYDEPEQQGKIYYQLAHVYAQSGQVRPGKTIEYAKKALEFPLDPLKELQLYVYWGDAIQVAHRGVRNKELVVARREAVMPYLQGLGAILRHDVPDVKPDLPVIVRTPYEGPPGDPRAQELRRELEEQVKARELALLQRDMIDCRDTLTGQISFMYSRFPFASDELESLAKDVLKDGAAVDHLMTKVKERVQVRIMAMGGEILEDLPEDLLTEYPSLSFEPLGESKAQESEIASAQGKKTQQEYPVDDRGGESNEAAGPALPAVIIAMLIVGLLAGVIVWRRRTAGSQKQSRG